MTTEPPEAEWSWGAPDENVNPLSTTFSALTITATPEPRPAYKRTLVKIRPISSIRRFDSRHEMLHVDGWDVVAQRGEFSTGQAVLFFQLDCLVPISLKEFPWDYGQVIRKPGGKSWHHIRSRMHGKQLSQGVVCRVENIDEVCDVWQSAVASDGMEKALRQATGEWDLAGMLGVRKFEREAKEGALGVSMGEKPTFIPLAGYDRV